eukprot:CAMPEP_0181134066 /NCGR_PEP_ID=MMETSP1071-20121207/31878_1 /TAXON_ID=35127 /ORGANISM="Thalassiosira sp., Strain NH16" /LENGTH=217 /DNA_ID=CAMNT_0023220537 /DNA_START=161 /DNA_END=811 /DNA_ORIENTATION=+
MKSSPFLLALLSGVASAEASANNHPEITGRSLGLSQRRSFVTKSQSSPASSSSWTAIPRGGSDDDGSSSSSSTAPPSDMMSSLLSGMNLPGGGMPDMSQPPSPEQLQQSMEQFTSLLSSPQFKEMLADPSKMEAQLETMRLSLVSALDEMEKGDNPMMKMMLEQMKGQLAGSFPGGWDGLRGMINDADKWKEMMGGLIDVIKSLGEEDLGMIMQQMM